MKPVPEKQFLPKRKAYLAQINGVWVTLFITPRQAAARNL